MKAEEYYNSLKDKKHFTKLTSTGISDNLENVFEFAEQYAKAILDNKPERVEFVVSVNSDVSCKEDKKEVCGKINCNRPKLSGNVYCQYHYDINFG